MPVFFDHDPVTGVTQTYDYDPASDSHILTSHQDLSTFLDTMQAKRNNPDAWKKGVKESWAHYASVPPVIQLEMRKKGIDLHNPNHFKAALREVNENYPFLKATDKIVR